MNMNKNLCLNNSEKEWLLKVRSILFKPQPKIEEQPIPTPPNDEIWYTSSDGNIVVPAKTEDGETSIPLSDEEFISIFGANLISNTYENGKGIIKFDGEVTKVGNNIEDPSEDIIGGFLSNDKLTTITLPNSVTSIGYGAFAGCTSLTSITIPNSVTSIGESAFASCTGLTSITVDSNNSVYDSRNNCNAIIETATNTLIRGCKNTIIPNSVTSIGNYAFSGCTGLTSITIPESVTSIGEGTFYNCTSLTSINFPNSVTSIGSSAFGGCSGLTSITIPNSVTSIGQSAFGGCSGLTSITIPNSVTSIGWFAFQNCTGLTTITSLNTTPPTLGSSSVFNNTNNSPIYVPSGSVDTYKSASGWSTYADRIQAIQ